MSTYKIGNQINVIVRSSAATTIGDTTLQYGNQPYLYIRDVNAVLNFTKKDTNAKAQENIYLAYNHDELTQITLQGVTITDRLLPLLYNESTTKLFSKREEYRSDASKHIYLNTVGTIYQVFIYNSSGALETAYGTLNDTVITVQNADSNYVIYYSIVGTKAIAFDKPANNYMTFDFEVIGNQNDNTQDMCMHIERGLISVNKNFYFNTNNTNTVDLIITVVQTHNDYLTIK